MKIHYFIKEIRKEKDLTLEELSQKSGVSASQINDLENQIKCTTVLNLCKIAEALGVNEQELYKKEK